MVQNTATLTGTLIQRTVLRYTPAGVAVINLELDHQSQIVQADSVRQLSFTVEAIALGDVALVVDSLALGKLYTFDGFWAPAHHRIKRIVFHVLKVSSQG